MSHKNPKTFIKLHTAEKKSASSSASKLESWHFFVSCVLAAKMAHTFLLEVLLL
jgi:hypothetical protein